MTGCSLLATRICDLGLDLRASAFEPRLRVLHDELDRAGIRLRPRFYLSTEYGCIARTSTIGLLFTDGFAVLRRLAREHGIRVRTGRLIQRTLRHEVGHAFCYAHRLYETQGFREVFGVTGDFFGSYPDVWRPGPADRSRVARGEVVRLYAARHPDEDFACTFETFLADPSGGFARYQSRPVIARKLAWVAEAVAQYGGRAVEPDRGDLDEPASEVQLTLAEWFEATRNGDNLNLLARRGVR